LRVLRGVLSPMPIFPAWVMTKRLRPEEDALSRSPVPELSTRRADILLLPEIEAIGTSADVALTSNAASGLAVPIPRLPPLLMLINPILRSFDVVDGERVLFTLCQKPKV